ncbi:hypothetical protein [Parabacteroides timonensis]|uniref:hypothetical protein n=1 Tax=Parabacteroides timonensis TaxID=1871013 RepID=UPI00094EC297|nr:hypothetical protein [Parabacteroides timonensis]
MDANMRLDADKIELAKAILSITSKEELHARIDHSIAELDAGKGIPSSEVFHKMEQKYPWLCK